MKPLLPLIAVSVIICSCVNKSSNRYVLENGDKNIDWIEFVNDSTIRWVGPGPRIVESHFVEVDSVIVVETAPLSRGFLYRQHDGSLLGTPPFFEGKWKIE